MFNLLSTGRSHIFLFALLASQLLNFTDSGYPGAVACDTVLVHYGGRVLFDASLSINAVIDIVNTNAWLGRAKKEEPHHERVTILSLMEERRCSHRHEHSCVDLGSMQAKTYTECT